MGNVFRGWDHLFGGRGDCVCRDVAVTRPEHLRDLGKSERSRACSFWLSRVARAFSTDTLPSRVGRGSAVSSAQASEEAQPRTIVSVINMNTSVRIGLFCIIHTSALPEKQAVFSL